MRNSIGFEIRDHVFVATYLSAGVIQQINVKVNEITIELQRKMEAEKITIINIYIPKSEIPRQST